MTRDRHRHTLDSLSIARQSRDDYGTPTAEFRSLVAALADRLKAPPNVSADAVRHAHERWDGKGYPDGLAGIDIPLASRIVAVAAAYRAMSTSRPFRSAMQPRAIAAELRAGAETQFDPEVVAAMLELIDGV